MTPEQWEKIQYFDPGEFDSPDAPGSGRDMNYDFVSKLDLIRGFLGYPLIINSGFRTISYNASLHHSVDGSAHTDGLAADINCRSSRERLALIRAAMHFGIDRIGIGTTFIHLDMDRSKPPQVAWLY